MKTNYLQSIIKMFFYHKKYATIQYLSIGIFALYHLCSCSEEPYRLDSRDRTIIDTTANIQIQKMIPALEDSCKAHFEANVKKLTDSLVEFQIREIEKKLQQTNKK